MPKKNSIDFDVIIVGGGAAGLTAALFGSRRGLRTLVVTQDIGGQAATTDEVENYPGVDLIDGPTLMRRFRLQAETFGAQIVFDEVTKVVTDKNNPPLFTVSSRLHDWTAHAVIMAEGLSRQHLNVPGETELYKKGVVYTASEEAGNYKNKVCAVIGGGNSAAQAALLLAEVCKKVYIIHRRDVFSPETVLLERIKKHSNISLVLNSAVTKINGKKRVESIDIQNLSNSSVSNLILHGVFIEIGFIVKKDLVRDLAEINDRGNIVINARNETSVPGLFAAGDVSSITYKQIVISAGEGAKAAMSAQKFLQSKGLVKAVVTDWGRVSQTK